MMTRRTGIIAGLLFATAKLMVGTQTKPSDGVVGLTIEESPKEKPTVLEIRVEGGEADALAIHYKGRVARVSIEEVMEALGAVEEMKL